MSIRIPVTEVPDNLEHLWPQPELPPPPPKKLKIAEVVVEAPTKPKDLDIDKEVKVLSELKEEILKPERNPKDWDDFLERAQDKNIEIAQSLSPEDLDVLKSLMLAWQRLPKKDKISLGKKLFEAKHNTETIPPVPAKEAVLAVASFEKEIPLPAKEVEVREPIKPHREESGSRFIHSEEEFWIVLGSSLEKRLLENGIDFKKNKHEAETFIRYYLENNSGKFGVNPRKISGRCQIDIETILENGELVREVSLFIEEATLLEEFGWEEVDILSGEYLGIIRELTGTEYLGFFLKPEKDKQSIIGNPELVEHEDLSAKIWISEGHLRLADAIKKLPKEERDKKIKEILAEVNSK